MGHDGFLREGRLQALARAALFVLLFLAFAATAVLLLPGLGQGPLPDGQGMPIALLAQFIAMLASALSAAWLLRALVERRAADGLGFPLERAAAREMAGGIVLGALAMALVVGALLVVGVYRLVAEAGAAGSVTGWVGVAVASLAAFAIPAAAEEALFRGYLMSSLADGIGTVAAVVLTSIAFAFAHGGNPAVGPLSFANIFLAGVLLAVAVLRTGTLWLATGVHLGWNWIMAGPLDLPVSGLDAYDAPFYDAIAVAPEWLSGGAFGPEGGLAGTGAALLALALILWSTRPGAPLAPADPARRV